MQEVIRFWEKSPPRVRVCVMDPKFCPNDKREEKMFCVAITAKWRGREVWFNYYYTLIVNHIWGLQWHHSIWPWVSLKDQIPRWLMFWNFIWHKCYCEIAMGHHIYKTYMGIILVLWHLILSDFEKVKRLVYISWRSGVRSYVTISWWYWTWGFCSFSLKRWSSFWHDT